MDIHAGIKLSIDGKIINTTVGRVLLSDALPPEITPHDVNRPHDQTTIGEVIAKCYAKHGPSKTVELLDLLKRVGFKYATISGLSIAIGDMIVPPEKKELIDKAQAEVERIDEMYQNGLITEGERYNKIIDQWTTTTELVSAAMLKRMEKAGIVERRPDAADGRVTRVRLTEVGRERERQTRAILGAAIGAVLDSLGEPDRKELARLLDLVAERARQVAG